MKRKIPMFLSLMALCISIANFSMTMSRIDLSGPLSSLMEKRTSNTDVTLNTFRVETNNADFKAFIDAAGIKVVDSYSNGNLHVYLIPNRYESLMNTYSEWKKGRDNHI